MLNQSYFLSLYQKQTINTTLFICPKPLVYAYSSEDQTIWAYQDGNCAVPCPTINYTHSEWESTKEMLKFLLWITLSLILITVVTLNKNNTNTRKRLMFLFGFGLSSLCFILFFVFDGNDKLICSGTKQMKKNLNFQQN